MHKLIPFVSVTPVMISSFNKKYTKRADFKQRINKNCPILLQQVFDFLCVNYVFRQYKNVNLQIYHVIFCNISVYFNI